MKLTEKQADRLWKNLGRIIDDIQTWRDLGSLRSKIYDHIVRMKIGKGAIKKKK